jgi:predicted nucleotide-binding protein (sugar kinase/HSP70/actin superfamily)
MLKMLHCVRPREVEPGAAKEIFDRTLNEAFETLRSSRWSLQEVLAGRSLRPLEDLIRQAAQSFGQVATTGERKPIILLIGEYYVREDARANQFIIDKIEAHGGQVCKSPNSEMFLYSNYKICVDQWTRFRFEPSFLRLLAWGGLKLLNELGKRDERRLERAASPITHGLEEPPPEEIKRLGQQLFASHYGGEPIMALGRALYFALQNKVHAIANVVPFTCMPGSTVAAQSIPFRERFKRLPFHTFQYDGYNDPNREKRIELMVYQAREVMEEGVL